MGKYILNKLIALILIFAVSSVGAESTADDSVRTLPAPTKKSNWKASAFAGCALIAVVGGIFAICWSGGGNTPKNCPHNRHNVTADCIAGSCIYHETGQQDPGCCNNGQQQVIPNPGIPCQAPCCEVNSQQPCCANNGGVPPF